MKRLVVLFLLISSGLFAQTGIGTTTPNASAKLDVFSTNKGFLPPRVTLTSTSDATTIASPAEGLLVYNLGSVGLQAGYYYWNGANWATIATATSAGNGVTSMDMVKLYGKTYSAASGDIAHANGFSFTVPVSGRYLFDFSSSGYLNQAAMTITFKVRQGTTDLGSDNFSNVNNNVHVVFDGKVEVNLQAGVTYNVYVTSTGSRDSGDYDRVYYKLMAGNLPVTGQSVDYILASLSANQTLSAVGNIPFNVSSGTGISMTNGGFNLIANKTYKLEAAVGGGATAYAYYGWVDNSNTLLPGGSIGAIIKAGNVYADGPQDKAVVYYTPVTNSTVYLRVYNISGNITAYAPSTSTNYSSTWATIQQIGSSAFVNPWTLSGSNTYNTSGNVGIGTNAPIATLDVSGNVNVTGKINLTDPTGSVTTKAAGFVDAGTYVTLDNVRATVTTSGSRGLGLATVTGSFSAFINGTYTVYTTGTNGQGTNLTVTTTSASSSLFGWTFVSQGDASTYIVNDMTNKRIYRITLMIGGGYYSNLITIERLL
jgi:hypothetical protein